MATLALCTLPAAWLSVRFFLTRPLTAADFVCAAVDADHA